MIEFLYANLDHTVSWCATVVTLLGVVLVARKSVGGWLFKLVGAGLWFWFAFLTNYPALKVEAVVFAFVNAYGWARWTVDSWADCACERGRVWPGDELCALCIIEERYRG